MAELSHIGADGVAKMVDVSGKHETVRVAVAEARVYLNDETYRLVENGQMAKGDVLSVARVAGIMAAKKTSELIPLCHPLPLDQVAVDFVLDGTSSSIEITASARTTGRTGVEMEALTAASLSALTIYDMCKAADKAIRISDVRLLHKSGGKSGTFDADSTDNAQIQDTDEAKEAEI
jgi:cyclic pyranopterin phosphate synthase